ncbi:MAG: serine hydrolase domain-containing protein [Polyangiaceae bacterium]
MSARLELLLAHRSGLDGHRPLYRPLTEGLKVDRSAALREAAMARRSDCAGDIPPDGFSPEYSDLGYLLLGAAIESASGESLGTLIDEQVMPWAGRCPVGASHITEDLRRSVAATEEVSWRGGVIQGAVHDENAWAIGGVGVCGHAGLFGTASDVLALGILLAETTLGEHDDWLTRDELDVLTRPRHGGTLRAGFDGKSERGSSAGAHFGPRSFGHLGFTGTSLWVDPDAQLVAVLLTNRVHPRRERAHLRETRPMVHDAIVRWADQFSSRSTR